MTPIDGVEVIYEYEHWHITAGWPVKKRRDVTTVLRIQSTSSNPPRLVLPPTNLNLYSASGRAPIVAAMNRIDKATDINPDLVAHILDNLAGWYRQTAATTRPTPKQREGDRWLLYPLWPSSGGTLVAAGTNSYKSFITAAVAVQTTTGIEVLAGNTRPTQQAPILFIDWEANRDDFAERLYAIHRGVGIPHQPSVAYRGQMTLPLADVADTLRDEIVREGYGGVILDSLSAAIGGSLVDDELANIFWNAVSYLGVPAFITAHKSDEAIRRGIKKQFGSVMHENRSRMLWDATRDPNGTSVVWEVVSDNNTGRKGNKVAWDVNIYTEGEHEQQRLEAAIFKAVNPKDVRLAVNEGDTTSDRMFQQLISAGPMTVKELASAVGSPEGSVRKLLSRHSGMFDKHPDGIRWGVK